MNTLFQYKTGDKIVVTMPTVRGKTNFNGKPVSATVEKVNKKSYRLGYSDGGCYQSCFMDKFTGYIR
jgi:hypothetical protein